MSELQQKVDLSIDHLNQLLLLYEILFLDLLEPQDLDCLLYNKCTKKPYLLLANLTVLCAPLPRRTLEIEYSLISTS